MWRCAPPTPGGRSRVDPGAGWALGDISFGDIGQGSSACLCTTLTAVFPPGETWLFLLLPRLVAGGDALIRVPPQTYSLCSHRNFQRWEKKTWSLLPWKELVAKSFSVSLHWLSHISLVQRMQCKWVPSQDFGIWPGGNSRQNAGKSLRNSFYSLEFITV